MIPATLRALTAQEADDRIGDWYRRGYVVWNDLETKSTHLSRVSDAPSPAADPHSSDPAAGLFVLPGGQP